VLLRLPVVLAALVLPPLGAVRLGQALADRWGAAIGREAAAVAGYLIPTPMPPPAPVVEDSSLGVELDESLARAPDAGKPPTAAERKAGKRRGAPARVGVFVPAATVLRLAQAQVMPRAVAVGPLGARPAGLRLIGVGGLGIGMRDGDVLTRVLGAPVSATGEVVSRVISARGRRAREISGEFWRNGAACSIVVEQPYLEAEPAKTASP
jgi:hypothetical protein